MDNINSRLTNLHKTEGILSVRWATYAEAERGHDSPEVKASAEAGRLTLDIAEHDLLQGGHHVLQDSEQGLLWHFILSGPLIAQDPKATEKVEQAQVILARFNLRKTSSGSLRRADIAEATASQLDNCEEGNSKGAMPSTQIPNDLAFQQNALLDTSLSDRPQNREASPSVLHHDNLIIYTKIREAIINSIIYALVSDGRHIPLSPTVLIARKFLIAHDYEMAIKKTDGDEDYFSTSCFSIKAAWFPDGTVFILSYPTSVFSLWPTSEQHLQKLLAKSLLPVILAPTGLIASIIGHQVGLSEDSISSIDGKSLAFEHVLWQDLLRSWLERRAIFLLQDDLWVWVSVNKLEKHLSEFNNNFSSSPILWPRELCFDITDFCKRRISTSSQEANDSVALDALSDAEEWFVTREARKEVVNAQRLEEQRKEFSAARHEMSDDDILSELLSHHETAMETQAVSGIYPTPPEGTRISGFHNLEEGGLSSQYDDGDPMDTDGSKDRPGIGQEHGITTDIDMINTEFEDLEEVDLFTNLEGNMYADNGITEDDFSFFDDPGQSMSDRGAAIVNTIQAEVAVHSTEAQFLPAGQPTTGPDISPPLDEAMSPLIRPEESASVDMGSQTPDDTTSLMDTGVLAVSNADQGSQDTSREGYKDLGSFTDGPISFNQKYGITGKFAFATKSQPSTLKPWNTPNIDNSIPMIKPLDLHDHSDLEDDDRSPRFGGVTDENEDEELRKQSAMDFRKLQSSRGSPQSTKNSMASQDAEMIDTRGAHGKIAESPEQLLLSIKQLELSSGQGVLSRRDAIEPHQIRTPTEDLVAYVRLFQLVADQLVHYEDPSEMIIFPTGLRVPGKNQLQRLKDPIVDATDKCFPQVVQCTLENWLNIGDDVTSPASTNKPPSRQPLKRQDTLKSGNDSRAQIHALFPLAMPIMRAKRGSKNMEMSYLALQFWEELGLSPLAGPKNITAFCVYPENNVVRRGVSSFLSLMGSTYTSLRLGLHTAGQASMKEFQDGLVPFPSITEQPQSSFAREVCQRLGKALLPLASLKRTIVIYMVNNSWNKTDIKIICAHFLLIFDCYASLARLVPQPSDLVLKILPMSWIASPVTVPVPAVPDLMRLSKEVYDRCPVEKSSTSPYASHSFTKIAEAIPKNLEFKVSSDSNGGPFQHDSFAHLGYCWDDGSLWLTAALTDNLGCHTWMASYYVGLQVDPIPAFQAIAREILEVAREAVEDAHGKPRIIVVKDETMAAGELAVWTALGGEEDALPLVLATIDRSPPLYLFEGSSGSPQVDVNQLPSSVPGTPDLVSSDMNSPRYPEESELSTRLASPSEETWAITSASQIIIDGNEIGTRSSTSSGFLVKHGQATMGIRILRADTDLDAKSLLKMYHALTCLSQAKGFQEEMPWHMAVARRAQSGLSFFG